LAPGDSVVGVSLVLFKELLQEEIGSIRCHDTQPIRIQRNDTLHIEFQHNGRVVMLNVVLLIISVVTPSMPMTF